MTIPTPSVPLAIGPEAAELLAPVPQLTLVRDEAGERLNSCWIPAVCSALVIGAYFLAAPGLTDSLTGKAAEATLKLSPGYKALAPICDTLDTISLFSLGQHVAFLLTCALGVAAWRVIRSTRVGARTRLRDELTVACRAVLILLGVYVAGAMLPRPIAKLTMSSPDEVVVDFHSHTRYSWDGRSSFSPEDSRRWHHASGFDVAYVTDHGTFAGAEQAARKNPAHAGDGTVMLSGVEVRDRGNHLIVLGTDARDWPSYAAGDLHEQVFEQGAERRAARPVVLFTLPGNLKSESAMAVDGIELSDAAPRGLTQSDGQREAILGLALDHRQSLVASSNNHGWASASPAWSVMKIHDWRRMTPAQLDVAIRQQILREGTNAVQVIDRRAPGPISFSRLALTVPDEAWQMLRTISWAERASWLIWIWVVYALVLLAQKIRATEDTTPQQQSSFREFTRWRHTAPIA
ncbi:MAG TPA: hypothetical protein VJ852_04335 [Gemmatimonadaceae bacterium]|nr:hypothetical protein [Gemmatimonadaceae bacterium]